MSKVLENDMHLIKATLLNALKSEGFEDVNKYSPIGLKLRKTEGLPDDLVMEANFDFYNITPTNDEWDAGYVINPFNVKYEPKVFDFDTVNCHVIQVGVDYWYGKPYSYGKVVNKRMYTISEFTMIYFIIIPVNVEFSPFVKIDSVDDWELRKEIRANDDKLTDGIMNIVYPILEYVYHNLYWHLRPASRSAAEELMNVFDDTGIDFIGYLKGQMELQKGQLELQESQKELMKKNQKIADNSLLVSEYNAAMVKVGLNEESDRERQAFEYKMGAGYDNCVESTDDIKLDANNDPIPCSNQKDITVDPREYGLPLKIEE